MYFGSGASTVYVAPFCGLSISMFKKIVSTWRKAIADLHTKFIRRPNSEESCIRTQAGFFKNYGMPLCIGVMDGSFIPIPNPGSEGKSLIYMLQPVC